MNPDLSERDHPQGDHLAPRRAMLAGLGGLAAGAMFTRSASAGDLNPPGGPIGPTMKKLDIVEPRTPLGQADVPITISISGSYYLTENLFSVNAPSYIIRITASDVTLDLNGYSVDGESDLGITPVGILVEPFAENTEIRGGTVRDCASHGVDATGAPGVRLVGVRLRNNGGDGARLGSGGVAFRCAARDNGLSGLLFLFGGVGGAAIGCEASGNGGSGVAAVAAGVVVADCSLSANGADGVSVTSGLVSNCAATANGRDGVRASGKCVVRANNCHDNGVSVEGAGVRVVNGGDNRIEDNNCTGNDLGIRVSSGGNFIARNTCSGNTTDNWQISLGNVCLVVAAATTGGFSGDSGGTSPGSDNPYTNYTY